MTHRSAVGTLRASGRVRPDARFMNTVSIQRPYLSLTCASVPHP